jgi:RimJ/RimL family protein N-acetyltransferase
MEELINQLGQPIGSPLGSWVAARKPNREVLKGRFGRLEPMDPARHGRDLYAANSLDAGGAMWTYLPYGPFPTFDSYDAWLQANNRGDDPLFFTIVDIATGKAVGKAAYLRITPESGSIEVGHVVFSPALQRSPAATEAMFLMMRRAFQLGYRRYEWKCDALNAKSRAAAERLGFVFEGVFRQATVYKGRNRDTAWYSIVDREWPRLQQAFLRWLHPSNFDECGQQRIRLADFIAAQR